jgi:hypothetical protein
MGCTKRDKSSFLDLSFIYFVEMVRNPNKDFAKEDIYRPKSKLYYTTNFKKANFRNIAYSYYSKTKGFTFLLSIIEVL